MITQAIKRWLSQMLAWWPWRSSAKTEYAPTTDSLNKGAIQGATTWPATDGVGVASQPEIAPRRRPASRPRRLGRGQGSPVPPRAWARVARAAPGRGQAPPLHFVNYSVVA